MIDIIIATHGNLAEGLKDAVSLVVGEQENLECIGLRHEDSIDTFIENVKELAQRMMFYFLQICLAQVLIMQQHRQ